MSRRERPAAPLEPQDLERLALRYVERFATTRGKLAAYLERKLRERGWADDAPPDPVGIAQRMAERGYVDDRLYAEAKARAMTRRGLGERRVIEALRAAGVDAEDRQAVREAGAGDAVASALAFAQRRRIGPYGREPQEREARERQLAAMLRAGHPMALARRIVGMNPGDPTDNIE